MCGVSGMKGMAVKVPGSEYLQPKLSILGTRIVGILGVFSLLRKSGRQDCGVSEEVQRTVLV